MGAYTLYDLSESLDRVNVDPMTIRRVLYAFGEDGDCAEWEGGFVFETAEGAIGMVSGWCDTTGWGCRDGAKLCWFSTPPDEAAIREAYRQAWKDDGWSGSGDLPDGGIDAEPGDLNRWLAAGCPDIYEYERGRAS